MNSFHTSRWQSACFALLMLIGQLPIGMLGERADESPLSNQPRTAEVSAAAGCTESAGLMTSSHPRETVVLPCFGCLLVDASGIPSLRCVCKLESLSGTHDQRNRIQLMDRILLQI